MQMIQYGESPNPAKRSEQPVLSLGAVEPLSGEGFFLTMPNCDTECTNIFLEKLSEQYPDDIILLVCDGAAWGISQKHYVVQKIYSFFLYRRTHLK